MSIDADRVTITGTFLKEPLSIPLTELGAVVRQTEIVADPMVYRRRVRNVRLSGTDANVLLVCTPPAVVPKFKYGAEKSLAISARERKRGVALDVIGLSVDEPDPFVAQLAALGVRNASLPVVLSEVIGVARGGELDRRLTEERARVRKVRLGLALSNLMFALLIAYKLGATVTGPDDVWSSQITQRVVGAVALSVVVAWLSQHVTAAAARPRPARVRPTIGSTWVPLVALIVGGGLILARIQIDARVRISLTIIDVLLAGVPYSVYTGVLWKRSRVPREVETSPFLT
jgi:hypothetical protein